MVDPLAIVGGIVSAPVFLDTYQRLFGGWLTDRGEVIRQKWSGEANVRNVVEMATTKIPDEEGAIPPRVAAAIVDQAQWADDDYVAQYLAGVLASARTRTGDDDRGLPWAKLIDRLPADQLRLHHALYMGTREAVLGQAVADFSVWTNRLCAVGTADLAAAIGWHLRSDADEVRLLEAAQGLQREGLIAGMAHGDQDFLLSDAVAVGPHVVPDGVFLLFSPTADGIGLFLRAHGLGDHWLTAFSRQDLDFTLPGAVDDLPDAPTVGFIDELPLVEFKSGADYFPRRQQS